MMEQSTEINNNEITKRKKGRPKGTATYTEEEAKEPSNEEQYVNETIKEKENENILDYEKNDDLEQSSIDLEEITINPDGEDSISIKNPKEIYEEIYRVARIKAKKMRAASIEAFLEAKRIKSQYVLDDIEDSDSEDYTDDEVIDF